jgi:hypothetical protein
MFRDDWSTTERQSERREREATLRRQSLKQSWPTLVMIPILIGILHTCAWSLLMELFLHESFGLSGGNPAPWPGAIAVIFVASFWCNRFIARLPLGTYASQAVTLGCWVVAWLAWIALEPAYRDTTAWSHPGQFVQSEAYLIMPLLISMVVWWVGLLYASGIASISAEDIRTTVQRDWLVLVASILLAALVDGSSGDDALAMARIAVPLQIITSLALVAGAEVESTRRMAQRRGALAPGWGRWARLVGGLALGVLLLTLVVLAVLSPGALNAVVSGIAFTAKLVGTVIGYILLAVVWAIFQVIILITNGLEAIFGDLFGPVPQPNPPTQPPMDMEQFRTDNGEVRTWEYAVLLRWVALAIVIAVAAVLLFRFTRRSASEEDGEGIDEQRDSVFSADLARQQLRDLFRRRHRGRKPPRLDLARPPGSVREAMVYLETLAVRQGVGRNPEETSGDFAARLRAVWPGSSPPLVDFPRRYDRVRYGEEPDEAGSADHEAALRDWQGIWRLREEAPPLPPAAPPPEQPRSRWEE